MLVQFAICRIERAGYITVTNKGYDKNVVVSFDYVDIH